MPAEWQPHEATWLAWPHNLETWPEQLDAVKDSWTEMVRLLAAVEKVQLLVNDGEMEKEATIRLRAAGAMVERVVFHRIPTVDVWMRDYGPTFITKGGNEGGSGFVDWIFNGWGGKYDSYIQDDRVAKEMARLLRLPVFEPGIVLEGGSIDVNGAGTCLTTEQCLLNPNRNPHLRQSEIERLLKDYLGVAHVIWLGEGIAGDDTDGHVDDIARFVDPTTVVAAVEKDSTDANFAPLQENYRRLQKAADQDGRPLSVVPLPMPRPVFYQGTRLPASYANFYVANGVVLVPTFNQASDAAAIATLVKLFPGREVIGIPCESVVAGLGALHCVTQQQPAG
jgi:agmatine deiminase